MDLFGRDNWNTEKMTKATKISIWAGKKKNRKSSGIMSWSESDREKDKT